MFRTTFLLTSLALAAGGVRAQVVPILPFARTLDLLVVDSTYDGVWRCVDWNQDGDVNDPGEVRSYYSDQVGAIALTNPNCIACSFDGVVYVGDSSVDVVIAMRDQNGDGDADDPGEHRVFFDANNLSGMVMASVQSLHVDALGRVYAAVANTSSSGIDQILVFDDLNGDGDANDPGEARDYHTVPGATATGDSIPTELLAGPTTDLYYAEGGATGVITKGIYRLHDGNFDGDCNDPGERTMFFDTTAFGAASPFHYGMAVDATGRFYVTDHSANEQVLTAFDADSNGAIEPGEANVFYQTSGSTWWDVAVRDDGAIVLCEDQTPDRLTLLVDSNQNQSAMDPGEAVQIYDDTVAANPNLRPRGATFLRGPLLALSPALIQIGQSTTCVVTTSKPAELAAVFLSIGLVPRYPLAPFGEGELDPANVVALGFGIAGNGGFALPLAIPNTASAVGTYGVQALAGDGFRLLLTRGELLTVTP